MTSLQGQDDFLSRAHHTTPDTSQDACIVRWYSIVKRRIWVTSHQHCWFTSWLQSPCFYSSILQLHRNLNQNYFHWDLWPCVSSSYSFFREILLLHPPAKTLMHLKYWTKEKTLLANTNNWTILSTVFFSVLPKCPHYDLLHFCNSAKVETQYSSKQGNFLSIANYKHIGWKRQWHFSWLWHFPSQENFSHLSQGTNTY